jgi:hypothetical protein
MVAKKRHARSADLLLLDDLLKDSEEAHSETIRRSMHDHCQSLPLTWTRTKVARAQSVTPLLEAGRVFLPESAPWLNDFVDELAAFPKGTLFIVIALIYLLCDTPT